LDLEIIIINQQKGGDQLSNPSRKLTSRGSAS